MPTYPMIEQVNDKWYYWPDAWTAASGPFEDYVAAHAALTHYLQDHSDQDWQTEDFTQGT